MSYGARWWKFDFHAHTPVSHDYGKGDNQKELKKLSPEEWLLYHMKAEIDCVAITDHNSGQWIDILRTTLEDMQSNNVDGFRPLYLFPGVEISVHGGIHLLAIFDIDTGSEHISRLLGKIKYDGNLGDTDECTRCTFTEVVDAIHELNGIAVPAHVDTASGLFLECDGNTLKQNLKSNGLLAMQVCDINYVKPTAYNELKLRLSELAGSDSHRPEHIGSQYTWVKMDTPNLEALKLALHDGDDAIIHSGISIHNPNDIKRRYYIKSMEVTNASKAGRGKPLKLNFSPWFTSIIGGRGSGKSSMIEFLRLTLNKEKELPIPLQKQFEKFNKVVQTRGQTGMLLPNSELRIEMVKDGREIALVWKENVINEFVKDLNGNWEALGESLELSQRFPIRLYSQKQLYEMTKNPSLLLQMIDSHTPKNEWLAKKKVLETAWFDSRRNIRDIRNKINLRQSLELKLKDIEAKILMFEEMGHSDILREYQNATYVDDFLNSTLQEVSDQFEKIFDDKLQFESLYVPKDINSIIDVESKEVLDKKFKEWDILKDEFHNIRKKIQSFNESLALEFLRLPWVELKKSKRNNYEEFLTKLKATNTNPLDYAQLLKLKHELTKQLEGLKYLEKDLEIETKKNKNIYSSIYQHELMLRNERKKIIEVWNQNNNDLIIRLKEMRDIQFAEDSFRMLIRKEGSSFTRDILDSDDHERLTNGFIYQLYNSDNDIWSSRSKAISSLLKGEGGYSKKFINHIQSVKDSTPEDIDRLLIWFPEDLVSLTLIIDGKEENIEVGSAGQRTAAMLSLLLSIDDSPLIIDQPEDDLDTRRITDLVVKGIRKLKNNQQIIMVTHNPNIPVNGSAEMIIHLNFAGGIIQIKSAGALQDKEVRRAVCDVMEGGSEALNNRYYRIFKALE